MKKGQPKRLTPDETRELAALADLPDTEIDLSDAPEVAEFSKARRGMFYSPAKQQLTLRLDADLIAWFREHATKEEGYQRRINRALREYVQRQSGPAG